MTSQAGKDNDGARAAVRRSLLQERLRRRVRADQPGTTTAGTEPAPTAPVGLSPYQRPLWVDYRMYPERRTAWIVRGCHLTGAIEPQRLRDALARLKERHRYLCCAIDTDGIVQPRDADIPLDVIASTNDPWQDAKEFCRSELGPLRLEEGKLFRVYLFCGNTESAVVLAVHHILADQNGIDLLTDELSTLFDDPDTNLPAPPDLAEAYARQVARLESQRTLLRDFWRQQLEQLPPVAPLPVARTPAEPGNRHGRLLRHRANDQLAAQCRAAAGKAGVSAYQWFLAGWVALLGIYYQQPDIHLGTMFSTRSGARLKNALGSFQNVLLLRADLADTRTFADIIEKLRSVVGDAVAHGTLPLDELAQLAAGRIAGKQLFSSLFTLLAQSKFRQLFGLDVVAIEELDYGGTAFDLTFFVLASGDDLSFAIEFDTAVYDEASAAAVFDHYETLLAQMAADASQHWRQCTLVNEQQLERHRTEWQRIAAVPLPTRRLHDEFFAHARQRAEAPALRWQSKDAPEQLSYGELAARAEAIASYIDSVADRTDTTVAVLGHWHPDSVAAILGILRSGRAYLPVDASYPAPRIAHILEDAGRPLVLLAQDTDLPAAFADRGHAIDAALAATASTATARHASDIAYVIYTSGSSGTPKGVRVSHAAAAYSTAERRRVYAGLGPQNFLLLSSFAFDSAVAGLWWTLSCGACLRLLDRQTARAADAVANLIQQERITHTLCLPSQWQDICRIASGNLDSMQLAIVAGESCTARTVEQHFERAPGAALYNEYGPTEMSVWSTVQPLADGMQDPISIGRPLALTQALVIDSNGNLMPNGLAGELLLAGQNIAAGYHGGRTGGFVGHPLDESERAYRTGDRVRAGADGRLYYLGRLDEQVKFRGYRIGIESIELALGADGAAVTAIPWDGRTLEDLLAELPEHEALALIDEHSG